MRVWSVSIEEAVVRAAESHGYAKGRAKRAEIIDQTILLIDEVGYRAASLRDIAAQCDISHPGLLHHFGSKEALLTAVLVQRDSVDHTRIATDEGGLELLRRFVRLAARNADRRAMVELFAMLSVEAAAPGHPAHDYFVQRYRTVIAWTTDAFRRAQDAGVLREGIDPDDAGRRLVALMDGLQVQWLLDGGATDMPGAVRSHLQGQLTVPLLPAA